MRPFQPFVGLAPIAQSVTSARGPSRACPACPLFRRFWGLSGHRLFMSTRPSRATHSNQVCVPPAIVLLAAGAAGQAEHGNSEARQNIGYHCSRVAAFQEEWGSCNPQPKRHIQETNRPGDLR